ncbi:hypothetical protein G8O24_38115 [Bradyrhizobium sp. INPA01-394B]|uniref:Uncharacterized protein n=1 Tax=Bradyrhizobium campsiandrae TaxID=1729892 RepID=A0ABR7U3D1_9BRAD|nr:hypothetical protein [Bradyrhizobium campsiandrae]MBC9883111.1 hypothetical protein [Bradyrhizobium campsiandrae]MBC9978073.1 hypothetical protein [Bradyrhizobium campsiandrae]
MNFSLAVLRQPRLRPWRRLDGRGKDHQIERNPFSPHSSRRLGGAEIFDFYEFRLRRWAKMDIIARSQ